MRPINQKNIKMCLIKYKGKRRMIKSIIATLLLSIFLISFASAISIGDFQQNTDVELYQTCNNCTYCNLTSIKQQATTLLTDVEMTKTGTYYSYNLTSGNTTTIGKYTYCYDCGNNADSRTGCIDFKITLTGEQISLSNSIIVIVFLILAGIFLFLGFSFNKEHWILKTFFNFCSVGMGILAINSARIIASESANLGKMGLVGMTIMIVVFSLFFIYMFVYSFIEIIKALREKRGVRWKYD